ncbi:PfkB family carbohydrate kinase [Evansella tamaricis]|uniref:PfkB family carbohydrate kinase n=1 Tax=Evansella tamaricis TaxID=2069301 RepID=UPI00248481A6|nr:PfkB family carbohydrate kinase [Evansella tamaricis]
MIVSKNNRTGIVIVTLDKEGERSFEFFNQLCADRFLDVSDIISVPFHQYKIFHFGSISLKEPSESATRKALELAKNNGLLTSFDPNIRQSLWKDTNNASSKILSLLSQVDVLKVSHEELVLLTKEEEVQAGVEKLKKYNIPLVIVTTGAGGSYLRWQREQYRSLHHVSGT